MSRYQCHKCTAEHGTDNMVAYCASCYAGLASDLAAFKSHDWCHAGMRSLLKTQQSEIEAQNAFIKIQNKVLAEGDSKATNRLRRIEEAAKKIVCEKCSVQMDYPPTIKCFACAALRAALRTGV